MGDLGGKEPSGPPDPLPQTEREDVRVAANRCPYCHDDVDLDASEWVSCRSCQARHHEACWGELGACGSCGETRYLAEAAVVPRPDLLRFAYEAIDEKGARREGVVEAESLEAANETVRALGRFPIRLKLLGPDEEGGVFRGLQGWARDLYEKVGPRYGFAALCGTIALSLTVFAAADWRPDQSIGLAIAAGFATAAIATLLRARPLIGVGAALATLGVGLEVAYRNLDHVLLHHPETHAIGIALCAVGALAAMAGAALIGRGASVDSGEDAVPLAKEGGGSEPQAPNPAKPEADEA